MRIKVISQKIIISLPFISTTNSISGKGVREMLEFIFGLLGETILYFFIPTSKFEKNVDKLKQEDWFVTLEKDYRYNYIIWNNRKIKSYLIKSSNLELLIENEQEQKKFTELIKQEHLKFITTKNIKGS